jgi:hypothetical protein
LDRISVIYYTTVERIDYSNDTATLSIRGLIFQVSARVNAAATGNSNFGYFGEWILWKRIQ